VRKPALGVDAVGIEEKLHVNAPLRVHRHRFLGIDGVTASLSRYALALGRHYCLGASLARAEVQETLAFLPQCMPKPEADGDMVYGSIGGLSWMTSVWNGPSVRRIPTTDSEDRVAQSPV
jgi:hypothetical protein